MNNQNTMSLLRKFQFFEFFLEQLEFSLLFGAWGFFLQSMGPKKLKFRETFKYFPTKLINTSLPKNDFLPIREKINKFSYLVQYTSLIN